MSSTIISLHMSNDLVKEDSGSTSSTSIGDTDATATVTCSDNKKKRKFGDAISEVVDVDELEQQQQQDQQQQQLNIENNNNNNNNRNRSISPSDSSSTPTISSITSPDTSVYNDLADGNNNTTADLSKKKDEMEKNADYLALVSTLNLLKKQKLQCELDISKFVDLKKRFLEEPELLYQLKNTTTTRQSRDLQFPKPINILMCPNIKWDKYMVKPLDSTTLARNSVSAAGGSNNISQMTTTTNNNPQSTFRRSHRKTQSLSIDSRNAKADINLNNNCLSTNSNDLIIFKNYQLFNRN